MANRDAEDDAAITDDFALAGTPDAFDRLWTPHRMAYVSKGQSQVTDEASCPFCAAPQRDDETSLIVARGKTCYVVMNLYPYNPGHLLVCPYRHVPEVLREVSHAAGFNLGMNQGKVGGAGIAAHLHQHIVPRWGGDGNFLPIIAQTKNVTGTIGSMRPLIAEAWQAATDRFLAHQSGQTKQR